MKCDGLCCNWARVEKLSDVSIIYRLDERNAKHSNESNTSTSVQNALQNVSSLSTSFQLKELKYFRHERKEEKFFLENGQKRLTKF